MDFHRLKNDVIALLLLAAALFVGLSLASFDPADPPSTQVLPLRVTPINLCGTAGAVVALKMRQLLGFGAWFALLTLIAYDMRLFSRESSKRPLWTAVGSTLAVIAFSTAVQIANPALPGAPEAGSGGYIGAMTGLTLQQHVALPGVVMLVVSMLVAGIMLSPTAQLVTSGGRFLASPLMMAGSAVAVAHRGVRSLFVGTEAPTEDDEDTDEHDWSAPSDEYEADEEDDSDDESSELDEEDESDDVDDEPEPVEKKRRKFKVNPPIGGPKKKRLLPLPNLKSKPKPPPAPVNSDYELPGLDLLEDSEDFPYELLAKKAQKSAATLERAFKEFGLNVKVVAIDTGPVITQFELELEPGLRLNKITALADDLAIKLRVPSVRVVSSIPGKNTVGVEVPNEKQVMVRLRDLIENAGEDGEDMAVPLYVGKDVTGAPMIVDMAKMPHLLIAGRTGTGKSVCLNTLILSMLMTRTPEEVKMLMIDPKMVELSPYKKVPHLMHPVITDMKKAEAVLAWAVDKMEERYDLLARAGVRHLRSYNKLGREEIHKRLGVNGLSEERDQIPDKMPYIVIIADEMADMMMTCGKEVETHISRLAGKARAVGIHLVLATQKPTVDVVTGLIKSNLPARISFQVASKNDSRVVLDENGAEKLLGCGDMLYLAPGTSNISRAQGTFVSDDEVNDVIDFYSDYETEYSDEIAKLSLKQGGGPDAAADRGDEHYNAAVELVIREQRGSISMIQSKLGIGYGRAARMVGWMAEDGIVSDHNGSNAREVLYSAEQWAELTGDAAPSDEYGDYDEEDEEWEEDEDDE
jgi:S-DNA-T family DNA segregation ATPase FtsK/SpoIIIE